MSWLKIGDRAAGAIKSGGTTRRAAKMVCLDMDHPDIDSFVNWKVREEIKVAALVEGLKTLKKNDEIDQGDGERLGLELDYDFNGESVPDRLGPELQQLGAHPGRVLRRGRRERRLGDVHRGPTARRPRRSTRTELWDDISYAAWRCADPGVQYDSHDQRVAHLPDRGPDQREQPVQRVHVPRQHGLQPRVTQPAQVLRRRRPGSFDVERYEHAIDLWTMVLEISVLMAAFPSKEIAELSYRYRTLGLGYANLGAMLMQAGIPYDSDEGRSRSAGCSPRS